MSPLQLHHPNAFYLLWSMAIKRSLQYSCNLLRHGQGQEQADNERASSESAKKKRAEYDCNEQRLPNRAVAERGHEQVERRIGPLLVDEMKQSLVQVLSFKSLFAHIIGLKLNT
jgi:hypothetical protein